MTQPEIAQRSREIDEYYRAMLVDGMDPQLAVEIERMRQHAHEELSQQILAEAIGAGFRRR
jgi:hypothetical protein